MNTNDDANWWAFSIDEKERAEKIEDGPDGLREVNPALADGRQSLDYRAYIGLERLLSCQVPSSRVPDERVFVITHQLFELVFKLMAFDLAVVSETFRKLMAISDDLEFHNRCTFQGESPFWRPALTASARIKYGSRVLLPAFIGYLDGMEGKDETFNSVEFYKFRAYLPPASGFQTAQFRLIQRALGKGNLFSIRLYPAEKYWKSYEGKEDQRPVRVVDRVILREGARTAEPQEDSPMGIAAAMDDWAHRVLDRLSRFDENSGRSAPMRKISSRDMDSAVEGFRQILSGHRSRQEKAGILPPDAQDMDREAETVFRRDLEEAAGRENARRQMYEDARGGALYLHHIASGSHLYEVLARIVSADNALHGEGEESFLSVHYRMAAERIRDMVEYARKIGKPEPPLGTGGGGVPYLWHMRKNLIPLFPALVGFRDLADSPAFGWLE